MDNDIRDMLRSRADDVPVQPEPPRHLLERARRRRILTSALSGVTVIALVAGAWVGVDVIQRSSKTPSPAETPSPSPSTPPVVSGPVPFPGIWPETNGEQVQQSQTSVDEGQDPWRANAEQTAAAFGVAVFGWVPQETAARVIEEHEGAAVVQIASVGEIWTTVSLEQIGRQGEGGVWTVTGARADTLSLQCPGEELTAAQPAWACGTIGIDASRLEIRVDASEDMDLENPSGAGGTPDVIPFGDQGIFEATLNENLALEAGSFGTILALAEAREGYVIAGSASRLPVNDPSEWPGEFTTEPAGELGQYYADTLQMHAEEQLVPEHVLRTFAQERLRWDEVFFDDSLDLSGQSEVTVTISDCGPGADCVEHHEAEVTIARLLRQDPTGIWFVTDFAETKHGPATAAPTPAPTNEGLDYQEGLPISVEAMRQSIYRAAVEEDYEALAGLIDAEGKAGFTFTYGAADPDRPQGEQAVEHWKDLAASDCDRTPCLSPVEWIARLLEMPYTKQTFEGRATYAWPFAFSMSPEELRTMPDEQRRILRTVYGDTLDRWIEEWATFGGYIDYRLGINARGQWIFFVAGD